MSAEDVNGKVSMYLDKNRKQAGAAGLVKEVCYISNFSNPQVCVSSAETQTIPVCISRLLLLFIRRDLQKLLDGVEQPLSAIARS